MKGQPVKLVKRKRAEYRISERTFKIDRIPTLAL